MAHSDRKSRKRPSIALAPDDPAPAARLMSRIPGSQVKGPDKEIMHVNERAQLAKEIHDARRARDRIFPPDVFADPAWDILLILYWAHYVQQRLTVTNVSASAAVPPTTALRWIENLRGLGMVRKSRHFLDGRVQWLDLTADATAKLDQYFDDLLDSRALPHITRARSAQGGEWPAPH